MRLLRRCRSMLWTWATGHTSRRDGSTLSRSRSFRVPSNCPLRFSRSGQCSAGLRRNHDAGTGLNFRPRSTSVGSRREATSRDFCSASEQTTDRSSRSTAESLDSCLACIGCRIGFALSGSTRGLGTTRSALRSAAWLSARSRSTRAAAVRTASTTATETRQAPTHIAAARDRFPQGIHGDTWR